jgi:hypothetical protein
MQDGGKIRHYGIKNGFHLVLALSRIGSLQTQVRMKERQLWERDFDHFEDIQECRAMSFPSLIEDLELAHDVDRIGKTCKVAYLTEDQCRAVVDEMDHFVACLKLRRPKLILKFLGSYGDSNDLFHSYDPKHTHFPYIHCVPEVSVGDQSKVEEHLTKFVQDCILELAKNTNAIIIVESGANCGLSAAVRRVLGPVRDQMGDRCPFSLIGVACAEVVNGKSNIEYTNAQRVKNGYLRKNGKMSAWKILDDMNHRKQMAAGPLGGQVDPGHGQDDAQSVVSKHLQTNNMGSSIDLGGNVNGNEQRGVEVMGGANGEQAYFEEGDRVDAQYYKFEHWYPGRVTKLNANGTYVVEYDDGELEFNVSSVHLRKAQERGPHKIKGARTLKMRTHEVDLADGLSHYFIIEGEDNKAHFEQVFLSVITMNTPCLGFVTYGNEDNLKQIVDMVHRGLPLVLLDSRERYWTSPYIDVNDCKTYLAQKNLSFDPNSVARKLRGGLSLKSRERPYEDFFVAEQALKQHTEYLGAGGILELYENSTLAFLHALLNPGKTTAPLDNVNPRGTLKLYEAIRVAGKKRKLDAQRGTAEERADIKKKLDIIARMYDYTQRYQQSFIFFGILPKLAWWVAPFAAPVGPNGRPISRQAEMPGAHASARTQTMRDRSAAEKLKQRQAELGALTGGEDGSKDDDGPDIKFVEMIDEENFGVPASWVRDEESRRKYTPEGGPMAADPVLKETCKSLVGHLREWQGTIGGDMESFKSNPEKVLNAMRTLTAETVYSASLFDHDAIHTVIKKVCDIDHLPDNTSYESLLLLRDAWDAIDVYNHLARRYKLLTHVSYSVFLSTGVLIVLGIISQVRTRVENHKVYGQPVKVDDDDYELQQWFGKDEDEHDLRLKQGVMLLSLVMLLAGAVIFMYNPMGRWHGLRAAAMKTKTEVFKFRTRSGIYKTNFAQAHRRVQLKDGVRTEEEQKLRTFIVGIRQQMVDSALLKQASMNQKYTGGVYSHGQHAPDPGALRQCNDCCLVYCSCCCNDPNDFEYHIEEGHSLMLPDFHFAPMRPKDYICHRIDATMNFYSARVPRYSRVRFIVICIIVFGTLACTLMAAMEYTEWAAAVVAIVLGTAAWSEFHGTNRKLNRYSTVITELKNLKTWWFSLDQREQMIARHCDKLVMMGEAIIGDEHLAWASESRVQRIAELSERVQVKDDYASGEAEATEGRPGSSGTKGHRSNEQSGGLGLSGSRANLDNRSQQNE